ncbi:hypothetical protein TNCV_3750021 [Trichonephila clavipes]|nr:hypothetical protein TNCV_3750021 [Trichonephila clavipes]
MVEHATRILWLRVRDNYQSIACSLSASIVNSYYGLIDCKCCTRRHDESYCIISNDDQGLKTTPEMTLIFPRLPYHISVSTLRDDRFFVLKPFYKMAL